MNDTEKNKFIRKLGDEVMKTCKQNGIEAVFVAKGKQYWVKNLIGLDDNNWVDRINLIVQNTMDKFWKK